MKKTPPKRTDTGIPKVRVTKSRTPKQKLLFFIDAWETLDHEKDTTLRLIEEGLVLGFECYLSESRTISLHETEVTAHIARVLRVLRPRTAKNIQRESASWQNVAPFDHFFYRHFGSHFKTPFHFAILCLKQIFIIHLYR